MQDDYIEEDFLEEEYSSNRRPFLLAVGVLVTLFILMGVCTAVFLVNNRAAQERDTEIAAIETRNAETEAANAATAIAATETAAVIETRNAETEAANAATAIAATETAAAISAEEPTPETETPTPTNTAVVEDVTDEEAVIDGEDEEAGTPDAETDDNGVEDNGSGGDEVDEDATPTPISALSETGDGGSGDALPQTGLDTWGVVLIAFVLVGLFVFARRLRTTG